MATRTSRASASDSARDRIIEHLAGAGGRISSTDGRGLTRDLAKAAGYTDLGVLNAMLSRLEREGVLTRDIRGRRTFSITLRRRSAAGGAAKKTAAKKTSAKKATAKKATAKKATAKKSAAKKSAAKKTTAKKTTAKKSAKKATKRR